MIDDGNVSVLTSAEAARRFTDRPERTQRTDAQKLQDQLLDTAADAFTDALELIETGLEALEVLGVTPQHRNLPTLLGQQIAQVAETRRIRQ